MTDLYRPLYFMLEAVELEAKRKLAERSGGVSDLASTAYMFKSAYGSHPTAAQLEKPFRYRYPDDDIEFIESALEPELVISHRCRICRRRHRTAVSRKAIYASQLGGGMRDLVGLISDRIEAMLQQPCEIDLGESGKP